MRNYLDFLNTQEEVRFLQIGSNDGRHGDPIHHFVAGSRKWKGILVEPVGFLFKRLQETYSHRDDLIFEKVLISKKNGEKAFYYVSEDAKKAMPDLPSWHDQLGSFTEQHIITHLNENIRPYIVSEAIETMTLNSLLQKHSVQMLDLLHIDTEGHDFEIFRQLDLRTLTPKVIIIEFRHLRYWTCYRLIKKLLKFYVVFSNGTDFIAIEKGIASQVVSANA
jgi:FkbM family methyltransferase